MTAAVADSEPVHHLFIGSRSSPVLAARVSHFTVIFVCSETHLFQGCRVWMVVHASASFCARHTLFLCSSSLLRRVVTTAFPAEPHRRVQYAFCRPDFLP